MDELPPEVKAQLEEQKKNCVFCKILSGEIPAKKVYEDNLMAAVLDINPCAKGHTLLMPKEHYPIMPLIPKETFRHIFGFMPRLVAALKSAVLTTGANVIIANGAVAGQQAPHFLMHLLPREKGDWLDKYGFNEKRQLNEENQNQAIQMLANNLPAMMKNHFAKQPPNWETKGEGSHAKWVRENNGVLYEDEKVIAAIPGKPQQVGHIVIYSKEEQSHIENIDYEASAHLFYVASFAATAVFEGLKAQGSNIILKTGESDDNPEPLLEMHVLPRYDGDGFDLINQPMKQKPDMEDVTNKIKDKMFFVEHSARGEKKEEKLQINLDEQDDGLEEIRNAIRSIRG